MTLELRVIRVQVQLDRIKPGVAPHREYRPGVLHEVAELHVTADGVIGVDVDGTRHIDVHHREHPHTRDAKGRSGISIMATGDYVALRERYGPHLVDGIAGESVLVEYAPGLAHRALPAELGVVGHYVTSDNPDTATDVAASLRLLGVHVAKPCVEFTRFCLRRGPSDVVDDDVRRGLVDLDDGARGYKMVADAAGVIRPGDVITWDDDLSAAVGSGM